MMMMRITMTGKKSRTAQIDNEFLPAVASTAPIDVPTDVQRMQEAFVRVSDKLR